MHTNSLRLTAIIGASLLACLSGCQLSSFRFPGFRPIRWTEATPDRSDEPRRLTDRQIAEVQLSLAHSLELQGNIEQAMSAYRKAIEKAPKQATGYWRLAVLHDRQGRLQESASLYEQALKLDRKNAEIHCAYGYNLYLQRRWAEGEDHLRKAIAIKPGNARAHGNLGLILAQTERFDEAFSEFRLAGCSDADAHANLGFVSILNQNWGKAREAYNFALLANPNCAAARTGIEKLEALVARTRPDPGSVVLAGATMERPPAIPSFR